MRVIDLIYIEINNGNRSILTAFYKLCTSPSKRAVFLYRVAKTLYDNGHKVLPVLIRNKLVYDYGLHISLKARIDLGLEFRHINGVVIGDGVKIGKNCVIYQQVTLGGQTFGDREKGNYPIVGDNVTIFAGAKLLGNITIGDNSIIGANSVVICDVEKNSIYAGIPAKKVRDNKG